MGHKTPTLAGLVANISGLSPWSREWLDAVARQGGEVGRIDLFSHAQEYGFPSAWEDEIAAARRHGYDLRKVGGHGTAYGRIILTARSRRAARNLAEGRRRALQQELGCSADEAATIEPVCRSGWVRERAEEMLDHLRWLRSASPATVKATLDVAWREWHKDGRAWGPSVRAAARILDLDAPSVPRMDALLQAAFRLANRVLGWVPPEAPGKAARQRMSEITGRR